MRFVRNNEAHDYFQITLYYSHYTTTLPYPLFFIRCDKCSILSNSPSSMLSECFLIFMMERTIKSRSSTATSQEATNPHISRVMRWHRGSFFVRAEPTRRLWVTVFIMALEVWCITAQLLSVQLLLWLRRAAGASVCPERKPPCSSWTAGWPRTCSRWDMHEAEQKLYPDGCSSSTKTPKVNWDS